MRKPEEAFLVDQLQDIGSNSKEKYVLALLTPH